MKLCNIDTKANAAKTELDQIAEVIVQEDNAEKTVTKSTGIASLINGIVNQTFGKSAPEKSASELAPVPRWDGVDGQKVLGVSASDYIFRMAGLKELYQKLKANILKSLNDGGMDAFEMSALSERLCEVNKRTDLIDKQIGFAQSDIELEELRDRLSQKG